MTQASLEARAAFAGIFNSPRGRGLVATERDGLGLASLSVRRGQRAALAQRMSAHFGVELPGGTRRISAAGVAVAGVGPDRWLVSCENAGNAFSSTLKSAVGDAASVVDQSDAYAVIRLAGGTLRETLAKLVPIDLHPRAFGVGCVAGTLLGHIGALLWRLADGAEGEAVFEVAVDRSQSGNLWHELSQHAAELAG
jgi:methylglutamate dehydrogenase subunit D